MTEYTITKSCGTESFTIHPLEYNGPNNIAVPRNIREIDIINNAFVITSDLTFRFVTGFSFEVIDSNGGSNDGIYVVSPLGSTFDGTVTKVFVNELISTDLLPYGNIVYSIPTSEEATSLLLPGMGTNKYGEILNQNFVSLLENFNCPDEPIHPITGQLWYDGTAMKVYNGTTFESLKTDAAPNYELLVADSVCDNAFKAFTFTQTTPLSVWTVVHGLDDPITRIFVGGEEVEPTQVIHTGVGQTEITLPSPSVGIARFAGQELCTGTEFNAFTHEQTVASNTWTVTHGLNFPIVRVFVDNEEIQPLTATLISADETVLTFSNPEVGVARFIGSPTVELVGAFVLSFDLNDPIPGKTVLQVFVDGIKAIEGIDYDIIYPRTVIFRDTKEPAVGSNVEFYGF